MRFLKVDEKLAADHPIVLAQYPILPLYLAVKRQIYGQVAFYPPNIAPFIIGIWE